LLHKNYLKQAKSGKIFLVPKATARFSSEGVKTFEKMPKKATIIMHVSAFPSQKRKRPIAPREYLQD
jgi:hypothetical protein